MRFLKGKFWVLTVFLALFGQFSPLAARYCSMTQSSTFCTEIAANNGESTSDTATLTPCGHCCQQSETLVAILYSAPLIQSSRLEIAFPHTAAILSAQISFWDGSLQRIEVREVFREIDLPPPLEGFGSLFSCRAPPVEV